MADDVFLIIENTPQIWRVVSVALSPTARA
jgi:hypothetical protein